ncbi:BTAD domain-containing putative transcriptional regulator [Planomonospora alba]|uniref:BTAD domain-containing putative transcriptional regulator n=1 Tax=Planomonospora alba TaxID=161354 RepID=A0ABP6P3N6_9ACTN
MLAVLLLDANRAVTIGRLMEAIYGDDPPTTSRAQVQICISALRRLFAAHGADKVITTRSQGYAIHAEDGQLDAHLFESLLQEARRAREERDPDKAVTYYRQALGLWRGPALEGIESRIVQSAASRLAEHRITANEECIQLELDLGRHHELVGELTELVAEHPLRERLRGQLMLALYRSGRQAEALQVYRDTRTMMIEELGIEPDERLQQLEHAILTSDESLNLPEPPVQLGTEPAPAAAPPVSVPNVPGMLPTGIADFTGRAKQVDEIRQRLTVAPDGAARFAVPLITIAGKAGVGKTTIAVHVAHSVTEHFPDGQLFADLHGAVSRPTSPMQVLERFLRVLGVPGNALPDGLEERAEMYRALLADRRMLIVLDDAANEGQILPLLPGNPASAVIVTSRSRLAGLAGATHVGVDLFDSVQSVDLLARIAGVDRVQSEADAAAALADLCGRLPLALRIAGARLAARPHWNVGQLVERLEDETRRLDELKHGEMGIRASISLTYDSVGEEARRLFRRLAILDTHVFSAWTGAALLDCPFTEAQDLLDDLADAQLVETAGTGRGVHAQYRFHDLIRVFARERLAAEESTAERDAALSRVLGGLLMLTDTARRQEYGTGITVRREAAAWSPSPDLVGRLVAAPIEWFERERATIVSGIRQAAQAGLTELCWGITVNAVMFFESRAYLDDWRETHELALEATRQAGDKRGHAAMLYSMGSLSAAEQRYGDAQRDMERAVELMREVGDEQGFALAVRNLGFLHQMNGRFEEAAAHYERALKIFRSTGSLAAAAYTLHSLSALRLAAGDLDGAKLLLAEALACSRAGNSRRVSAQVLNRMGRTHLQAGEPALAADAFGEALAVVREISDPVGEAYVLHGLGVARLQQGRLGDADAALHRALSLASTSSQRLVEVRVLTALGELAISSGEPEQAVARLRQAATLCRTIEVPFQETQTLMLLAEALHAAGDRASAEETRAKALALADRLDPSVARRLREQAARSPRSADPEGVTAPAGGA